MAENVTHKAPRHPITMTPPARLTELKGVHRVLVYGSLAYDRVMDYPGRFRDSLLPEKLHVISLSFAVPRITQNFGGTAGNIAYNLSLLGIKPQVLSSVGQDFGLYRTWLKRHGIRLDYVRQVQGAATAAAYIMTDKDDNQISAFYAGALSSALRSIPAVALTNSLVLVSPGNQADMAKLVSLCQKKHFPYVYDPGQAIPGLTRQELLAGMRGAFAFIGNDYEITLIAHKLGVRETSLRPLKVPLFIRTLGSQGSELWHNGKKIRVPAVKPRTVVDPTGAGDAYRAGLVTGLLRGWPLAKAGKFAALVATYAVEQYGTQSHKFSWSELKARYARVFRQQL